MPTRLLLIRHAHVDTGARLCGTFDIPLSDLGRTQLDTLLQASSAHPPEALYSSPLRRAQEVAARLSSTWQLPLQLSYAVREIYCGHLEGVPLVEL